MTEGCIHFCLCNWVDLIKHQEILRAKSAFTAHILRLQWSGESTGSNGSYTYNEAQRPCFQGNIFLPHSNSLLAEGSWGKHEKDGVKVSGTNKASSGKLLTVGSLVSGLTIALASASVLPVPLVAVVPAICPLLRGGQQLPCFLLVFSNNGLGFLFIQLPICHLIHIIAFFRQREVGYKNKREACGPGKCRQGKNAWKSTIGNILWFLVALGVKPRALQMLIKCSLSELYPRVVCLLVFPILRFKFYVASLCPTIQLPNHYMETYYESSTNSLRLVYLIYTMFVLLSCFSQVSSNLTFP